MKFTTLVEATSKFGRVDFYYSDADLSSNPEISFHTDDEFEIGPTPFINQIYKFGDRTKIYVYHKNLNPDTNEWYTRYTLFDPSGQRHNYSDSRSFHNEWAQYIDSIIGVYDTKPFGPQEVQEFRQVFNL